MSANIPETKLVSELLKPTGFNCPENLEGKTFEEATEGGGGDITLVDLTATANGTYTPDAGKAYKKAVVSVPSTPTQEKSVDITENGTTVITPDAGKALSKVTVDVNVSGGPGQAHAYAWVEYLNGGSQTNRIYFDFATAPANVEEYTAGHRLYPVMQGSTVQKLVVAQNTPPAQTYSRQSDSAFFFGGTSYERLSTQNDITLW